VADTQGRFQALAAYRRSKAEADKREAAAEAAAKPTSAGPPAKLAPPFQPDNAPGKIFDHDLVRRAEWMVASDRPVVERLASFWTNHFAIAATRDEITVLAVPYENEAIRPHLFGSFRDLLGAAATHPAMTLYLDAAASVGPDSPVGQRRHKAVNENFAREVMELHTLGVTGGYTQQDVQELALALTGLGLDSADGETAWFFDRHEPGARRLLGHTLPERGDQLPASLDVLAAHPATMRHVCAKLAAHFCGDAPPRAVTQRLVAAWRGSGGHLASVYAALAASPEAWARRPLKYRTPQDFVLAAGRALALHRRGGEMVGEMRALGQGPFKAPAPTGWSDRDSDWINPAGMLGRVATAQKLAALAPPMIDATELLPGITAIDDHSPSLDVVMDERLPRDALALALASPEFQRR